MDWARFFASDITRFGLVPLFGALVALVVRISVARSSRLPRREALSIWSELLVAAVLNTLIVAGDVAVRFQDTHSKISRAERDNLIGSLLQSVAFGALILLILWTMSMYVGEVSRSGNAYRRGLWGVFVPNVVAAGTLVLTLFLAAKPIP